MSRRRNTPEERLRAVEDYLSGKRSSTQICQDLKLKSRHNIQEWVWLYQKHGEEAFVAREVGGRIGAISLRKIQHFLNSNAQKLDKAV